MFQLKIYNNNDDSDHTLCFEGISSKNTSNYSSVQGKDVSKNALYVPKFEINGSPTDWSDVEFARYRTIP